MKWNLVNGWLIFYQDLRRFFRIRKLCLPTDPTDLDPTEKVVTKKVFFNDFYDQTETAVLGNCKHYNQVLTSNY